MFILKKNRSSIKDSEKLKALLRQEELNGAKLENKVFLVALTLTFFILIANMIITDRSLASIYNFVGFSLWLLYHIVLFFILRHGKYNNLLKYITATVNITTVSLIAFTYSISNSWVYTLRTCSLLGYFPSIVLSGFTQRTRVSIYSGFLAATEYALLFCYAVFFTDVPVESMETFERAAISYDLPAAYIPLLLATGGLIGFISNRFRTVLYRSINSEAEAFEHEREKIKIAEAGKMRTNFFINLAHETKTPLTLISNYLDTYINKTQLTDDLKIIKQNMTKLKNDMLNFLDSEKLERNQVFFNHDQIIDFSDLLRKKAPLFREIAANKSIKLTADISDHLLIKADPAAIDRVINNLIDNAIKYTPEKGSINVQLFEAENRIIFSVQDTGIGISEAQKETIFRPYYQIAHNKRNIQGLGMGLHITKMIIDSLGGTITIDSLENKGSTFTVTVEKHVLSGHESITTNVTYTKPDDQTPVIQDLQDSKQVQGRHTLLIVEDNAGLLKYLQSHCEQYYNVYIAQNGKKALEKLNHIPKPDIIISDIMMDTMDGYDLCHALRQDERYNDIPFIFLSARTGISEKLKGLGEGALDYIYKPFSIDEVLAKIKNIIHNEKIKHALYEKDKFAALGVLTGGLCHEILNPINLIYAPVDLTEIELKKDSCNKKIIREYLTKIITNANRIEKLIKSMKIFSQNNPFNRQMIPLKSTVNAIVDLFTGRLDNRIELITTIADDIEIEAGRDELSHILINLISNAVDAIKETGKITISFEQNRTQQFIKITDTGSGIKQKNIPHIFNAFYTNKEVGKGVGLGLYIVKNLVIKSGWSIDVTSKENEGTEFIITL